MDPKKKKNVQLSPCSIYIIYNYKFQYLVLFLISVNGTIDTNNQLKLSFKDIYFLPAFVLTGLIQVQGMFFFSFPSSLFSPFLSEWLPFCIILYSFRYSDWFGTKSDVS